MMQPKTNPDDRLDLSDAADDLQDFEPHAGDPAPAPVDEVEEIELEMSPEAAQYVTELHERLKAAVAARQRALADFSNYQRRALDNEQQAHCTGVRQVIQSLLPILDHFDLALNQDLDAVTVRDLIDGVQIVRDEITKALQLQGVDIVDPAVGDEFDPNRHEAMLRQAAEGVEPGHIVLVMQPGYVIGDVVLRPAKVGVAPMDDDG